MSIRRNFQLLVELASDEEAFDRLLPVRDVRSGEEGTLLCSHCCRWPPDLEAQATWLEGCFTPEAYRDDPRLALGYHPRTPTRWDGERGILRLSAQTSEELVKTILRTRQGASAALWEVDLSGADLRRANLSGANLREAGLHRANLASANLARADLSGADLSGANLSEGYLSGADLSGANLSEGYLSGANLSGANLMGANLAGADLTGANLRRANLRGVDLTGAALYRAALKGADLEGALLP
jgi:uncharacterized protein YjbI with pentapeptide repeats